MAMSFSVRLLCVAALVLTSAATLAANDLLIYEGSIELITRKGEPISDKADGRKTFTLCVVPHAGAKNLWHYDWCLKESGPGNWPWTEHFQIIDNPSSLTPRPSLLYQTPTVRRRVALHPYYVLRGTVPNMEASPLKVGTTFVTMRVHYKIMDEKEVDGIPAWLYLGNRTLRAGATGKPIEIIVAKDTNVVLKLSERQFIEPGTEVQLTYALKERRSITPEVADDFRVALFRLQELRATLDWQTEAKEVAYDMKQVTMFATALPQIKARTRLDFVKDLLMEVEAAVNGQAEVARRVAALEAKSDRLRLEGLTLVDARTGKKTPIEFDKKVTILHFWEYPQLTLEGRGGVPPLEFAKSTARRKTPVQFFGVVVGDAKTTKQQSALIERINKEHSRTRLPLVLEQEKLLTAIGDPRTVGKPLPLVVVVSPGGRIYRYRAFGYSMNTNTAREEVERDIQEAAGAVN
jgi:hypothetical protein